MESLNIKANSHPLELIEQAKVLSNGWPKPADIKIEVNNGVRWVRIKDRPRGLGTFDKPGLLSGKNWEY